MDEKSGRAQVAKFSTGLSRIAGVAIVGLFFLSYVWPTLYVISSEGKTLKRVHRFTGIEEQATPSGWRRTDGRDARVLPNGESEKIRVDISLADGEGIYAGEFVAIVALHNGTNWEVTEFELAIEGRRTTGEVVISRRYRKVHAGVDRYETTKEIVRLDFRRDPSLTYDVRVVNPRGFPIP